MTTQALDPKLLPVLKTAAPDPTIFSEPTVFKDGSASNTNNAFFYRQISRNKGWISLNKDEISLNKDWISRNKPK